LRTLSALGKTTSNALIKEALEYAFSDEVKPQDTSRVLGAGALLEILDSSLTDNDFFFSWYESGSGASSLAILPGQVGHSVG